jgi:hypothetical protein
MGIIESLVMLVQRFTEVAMSDPLSAVLLTIGAIITGFSIIVFGYLSVGAIAKGVIDSFPTGEAPRQPGR